jgi:hypothetical protein
MAISKNLLMQGTSGTIDKLVVFRNYGDKLVVSGYPDMSKRKLSDKQKKQNQLMVDANEYAQDVVADEKAKNEAQVRLDVPRNKLYRALVKEYFATQKAK